MPNRFPNIELDHRKGDANPAVRLFGRRLYTDQTSIEFLIELLLVATSKKKLAGEVFNHYLPPKEILRRSWTNVLDYAPKSRLNLKLFSFFGASKLDTRHEIHRQHLNELDRRLKEKMFVSEDSKDNVLKTLENLFLGFHGVGMQRTWCAQSFVPICSSMIAGESIWEKSKGKNVKDWEDALSYFSHGQFLFLARGGEVLYLQICNALRQKRQDVNHWLEDAGLGDFLTSEEQDPELLHKGLEQSFAELMQEVPSMVSHLAEFIDYGVEKETSNHTDFDGESPKWVSCGWCPVEAWPEGYLFAVELLRVCRAKLDLMDKMDLLETLCSLQVIRSLVTQGARYAKETDDIRVWPEYHLGVSDPEGINKSIKHVSRATVHKVSKTIYDALRHHVIRDNNPKSELDKLYKQADTKYGHKLFLTMGKRIGLIVPKRGAGTRFVLNSRLLRLLVVSLSAGRRMTYDDFKLAAMAHFGLDFDEKALGKAASWSTDTGIESFGSTTDDWVINMLEEAGALRKLSDSCALVENLAAPER